MSSIIIYGASTIRVKRVRDADIGILRFAEPVWNVDRNIFMIGHDSINPSNVLTTKTTGVFDYGTLPYLILGNVSLSPNATIDNVVLSELNANNGILVRISNGHFASRSILNTDGSIQLNTINTADGSSGTIDLTLSAALKARLQLLAGGIPEVTHSSSFDGTGSRTSPLAIKRSSTTVLGGSSVATATEVTNGTGLEYITPKGLAGISAGAVTTQLKSLLTVLTDIETDGTLTGKGISIAGEVSPLGARTGTSSLTVSNTRGIARIATSSEVDSSIPRDLLLTPKGLYDMAKGSPASTVFSKSLGLFNRVYHDQSMKGVGFSGDPLGLSPATTASVGGITFATQREVDTGTDTTSAITPHTLSRVGPTSHFANTLRNRVFPSGSGYLMKDEDGNLSFTKDLGVKPFLVLSDDWRDSPIGTAVEIPSGWYSRSLTTIIKNEGDYSTVTNITIPGITTYMTGTPKAGAVPSVGKSIALIAGRYCARWILSTGYNSGMNHSRIYDTTNQKILGFSTITYNDGNYSSQIIGEVYFTLRSAASIVLQQAWQKDTCTYPFGIAPASIPASAKPPFYTFGSFSLFRN